MHMRFGIIPAPPPLTSRSRVRSHSEFNQRHIMGAINLPAHELVDRALDSLELVRDIYVYGDTDEEAAAAAAQLRQAGFVNVSEIQGGLPAWKAYSYPTEVGIVRVP
jgi:rhodanese-related sulfurtransferase